MSPPSKQSPRDLLLFTLGVFGCVAMLRSVAAHYPIRQWVLTRALAEFLVSGLWATLCLGAGLRLTDWLGFRHRSYAIRAVIGFPVGVFAFGVSVYLCAVCAAFGRGAFFALPVGFAVLGAGPLLDFFKRFARARPLALSLTEGVGIAFGAISLLLVYVPLLTVENVQHDARWYHLPIAAQYASSGTAAGFPEGWLLSAYPHFSSYLYAWCLTAPVPIVDRLGLAAHLEFVLFLATLASIPVAARCFFPGRWARLSWVVVFLFPGLFVYDSNLGTGADHIAALWAPAALVLLFLPRQKWLQRSTLLGLLAGAAMLTKYSAVCLAAPILLGAALFAPGAHASNFEFQRSLRPAVVTALAFFIAWSPHWLSNWIHFHDPLYPLLHQYLPDRPWSTSIAQYFVAFEAHDLLRPSLTWKGVMLTLRAAFTLGFKVNEYAKFHGDIPVFGFLFSVTLFFLPVLRADRKRLAGYGLTLVGVGLWYWVNHRDRYLQALVPWMACLVAGVLRELWVTGRGARAAAAGLMLTQAAAGAGVFAIASHIMIPGGHPLPHVMSLIATGYAGQYENRFAPHDSWGFADWVKLGEQLPKTAKVLVHEDRLWTGLDRPVVVDEAAWQGGIRYETAIDTRDIDQILKRYRATHVIVGHNHPDGGDHGVRGEALFRLYLATEAHQVASSGGLTAFELPAHVNSPLAPRSIYLALCKKLPGTYAWEDALKTDPPMSSELTAGTILAVTEDGCGRPPPETKTVLAHRNKLTFSMR